MKLTINAFANLREYVPGGAREMVYSGGASVKDLMEAIGVIRPGVHLWRVSEAVENPARKDGFGIVREYAGHGIGTKMHEE